ncbi:MAG: nucleotidyltransferase family protein [Anderseniella sp.]
MHYNTDNMTDTTRLMLDLVRAASDNATTTLDIALKPSLMPMIQKAAKHAVSPALAGSLRQLQKNQLAAGWDDVMPLLMAFETSNKKANKTAKQTALKLADILQGIDIEPVFLKGMAFILESDDSAPWRQISDIDTLIPIHRSEQALAVLKENGYQVAVTEKLFNDNYHHHLAPVIDPDSGLSIELHTRLMKNKRLGPDLTSLFLGSIHAGDNKSLPLILSPEDRMIHLVLHAQISNMGFALKEISMRDIVDASTLQNLYPFDWQALERQFSTMNYKHEAECFFAACSLITGHDIGWKPGSKADKWALASLRQLDQLQPAWKKSLRIGWEQASRFAHNPARLPYILLAAINPIVRGNAIKVGKSRLKK